MKVTTIHAEILDIKVQISNIRSHVSVLDDELEALLKAQAADDLRYRETCWSTVEYLRAAAVRKARREHLCREANELDARIYELIRKWGKLTSLKYADMSNAS